MNIQHLPCDLKWSSQQAQALDAIDDWLAAKQRQVFRLFGYAGTGKSTLARVVAERVGGTVVYGAFTGKAAQVLREKNCAGATTIDSLIYTPRIVTKCAKTPPCPTPPCTNKGRCQFARPQFAGRELNPKSPVVSADLVIIDECSMVNKEMGEDLLSFGVPVLVLGDPAQLPPVYGAGYFTNAEPDVMLTEIHRQAFGDPIITLATRVRERCKLQPGQYGDSAVFDYHLSVEAMLHADQVICGTHRTRHRLNNEIREALGFSGHVPQPGERLMAMKNNRYFGLRNGQQWTVVDASDGGDGFYDLTVEDDDGNVRDVAAPEAGFTSYDGNGTNLPGQPFCFAYAVTCHRAQGSQWDSVLVIDEARVFGHDRFRWLYTAITRAARAVGVAP